MTLRKNELTQKDTNLLGNELDHLLADRLGHEDDALDGAMLLTQDEEALLA